MENLNINKTYHHRDDDINLVDMLNFLLKYKLLIISITSLAVLFSVTYSLSLQNLYQSFTILAPSEKRDSLSSRIEGMSSLASLAGVNLSSETSNPSVEAIQRIKSYDFFTEYFLPNINLENLLAAKKWDQNNNKLIYDSDIYNSEKKLWISSEPPSNQVAYRVYENILSISIDRNTQFVTLSINHISPHIAKNWIEIIVLNINERMRQDDINKATKSITFLNSTSKSTNINDIKEVMSSLLKNQMQVLMLASANEDYIFKTLHSPIAPELRFSPNRVIIVLIGAIVGFIFSIFCAFFYNLYKTSKLSVG